MGLGEGGGAHGREGMNAVLWAWAGCALYVKDPGSLGGLVVHWDHLEV